MPGLEIAEAYLNSLLKTERASAAELDAYQARLLRRLVRHAVEETPFYAGRGTPPEDLSAASPYWRAQPLIGKSDLTQNFDAFRPRSFSKVHGVITPLSTGGSTGPAARRDTTSLEAAGRLLASYRMYHNWDLDQSRPLFVLRKLRSGQPAHEKWGFPWREEAERGDRIWIDIATPAREQLEVMAGKGPVYVNTLPSNILRLSIEALRRDVKLNIPYIVSVGEYLAPEVREVAAQAFGSKIIDAFSSAEGGVMAVQCPDSGLYHVQSEQVVFEILNGSGGSCEPGEMGEVVVTPLYGYATPLLRYRSGDYVVPGPACSCGRVLPTISSVAGRREHMFKRMGEMPALPRIDRVLVSSVLGHDEWALVQTEDEQAEFRHVSNISSAQEQAIGEHLETVLAHGFQCRFAEVEALPLTTGGKRHFTLNAVPR